MSQITFSLTESLELAALIPCIIIFLFLFFSAKRIKLVLIPAFYFLSLSCSFALPLVDKYLESKNLKQIIFILLLLSNLVPELSFLLIIQFITGLIPRPIYFIVLAIPLIGGSSFTYLYLEFNSVCLVDSCIKPEQLFNIYRVITGALVFLLLVFVMIRTEAGKYNRTKRDIKKHKYWLVVSMIFLNLGILSIHLLKVSSETIGVDLEFIETMIKVTFVYMVISSIYRVAGDIFGIKSLSIFSSRESQVAAQVEKMLEGEFIYRKTGFSRKMLARHLEINESQLSRIINYRFKKTFRDLINDYRINEAKILLKTNNKSISSIANFIGFTSITSFNRVFKEKVGESARDFRKKLK